MHVLVIDVGGTNVKVLCHGPKATRKFPSGPELTPEGMVEKVKLPPRIGTTMLCRSDIPASGYGTPRRSANFCNAAILSLSAIGSKTRISIGRQRITQPMISNPYSSVLRRRYGITCAISLPNSEDNERKIARTTRAAPVTFHPRRRVSRIKVCCC